MAQVYYSKGDKQPPRPVAVCPYGCQRDTETATANLTDNGYCRHLIGWTDDRQTLSLRETRPLASGEVVEVCLNRFPIEEGDEIIDSRGPSARVYRRSGGAPFALGKYKVKGKAVAPIVDEATQQKNRIKELELALEEAQAERDALAALSTGDEENGS